MLPISRTCGAKAQIRVAVAGPIVVPVRTTHVPRIIVPTAAAIHTIRLAVKRRDPQKTPWIMRLLRKQNKKGISERRYPQESFSYVKSMEFNIDICGQK